MPEKSPENSLDLSTSEAAQELESLPEGDQALDPRKRTLDRWSVGIRTLILLLLSIFGLAVPWVANNFEHIDIFPWMAIIAAGLIFTQAVFGYWWAGISYRRMSFRFDQQGLYIRSGVLWRSSIAVPRSRIQHTDVSRGPIEGRLGLATLAIHTAGSVNATILLPGLSQHQAESLRDALLRNQDDHDAV